jgi:hypothetical protein
MARGDQSPFFILFCGRIMKFRHLILCYLFSVVIFSCNQEGNIPPVDLTHDTPPKDTILLHIDSLKSICQPGDLLVRLGDDFISDRIRYLSEKDHSYSHAGIVVFHNNKKMVCHNYPDDFVPGADTVRYDAIDSFLNTKTNLKCALYRYDISDSEKLNLETELRKFHNAKVHFDKVYDLRTDDKLYCSEMIYKALKKVTNNRIMIIESLIPQNMQRLMITYFKKYSVDENVIRTRKMIAIDNLYNNPHCRLIFKFALKAIP